MTLGNAAAARVRSIVWCKACQHQVEPDPGRSPKRSPQLGIQLLRRAAISESPSSTKEKAPRGERGAFRSRASVVV